MADLKRNSGSIYYEVKGSGPPLVILRGLGRSIRHWLGYDDELSKYFRVVTIDNRGIGKSTQPHSPTDTIYDLAQDVHDIIEEIGETSAHIMGVSLGGMIALAMGIKFPETCKSITVVNTSIAGLRTLRMTIPGIKVVLGGLTIRKDTLHDNLANLLVGSDFSAEQKKSFAQKLITIDEEGTGANTTPLCQLIAAARFTAKKDLASMQVPTLVVYGGADYFVSNNNSKKIFALLPNAEELEIPGAGHELFVDKGKEFLKPLQDWVRRNN